MFYGLLTNCAILFLFSHIFKLILYIMLPLPSLMTENNFWTSEQRYTHLDLDIKINIE